VELRALAALVVCSGACSGSKTKVEDAKPIVVPHPADARPADAAPPPGKGDVSIRVEWHDVPLEARKPGACGPDVSPTTTWGIPDTVVTLAGSGALPERPARVVFNNCFSPRVTLASDKLTIASSLLQPSNVTLQPGAGSAVAVQFPIAGHEVDVALQPGTTMLVAASSRAWVIVPKTPYAALTDASGVAVLRDVPSGTYPVAAVSPVSGRSAKGEITVMPGQLAELTLQLEP
jgi:hypothetical protein